MPKERLTAFSDGVIAIIITIMVLELKVPHGSDWSALANLAPVFASYVLSFLYLAIYWNNHHYLMQRAIVAHHGGESPLARALGGDIKGKISPVLYIAAIVLAFFVPWAAHAIYVLVALMWLVPDRRIERALQARSP